ncbi:hypothetical protein ACOME3_009759 [Neoechinorhynchus agilis]
MRVRDQSSHELLSRAEDMVDDVTRSLKSVLPYIARFCLVSTFIEDGLRMWFQWTSQREYMSNIWKVPHSVAAGFIFFNMVMQLVPSVLVLLKKQTLYASACLVVITLVQVVAYDIMTEIRFILRVLSLIGGILLLLVEETKAAEMMGSGALAGLPKLPSERRTNVLQLTGRVLLVFMFLSILHFNLHPALILCDLVGSSLMILVFVGYKTKLSAMFLFAFLAIINIIMNPFWQVHRTSPYHDVLRYDFFQTLSVMGGLLYVVMLGPGGVSIDARKKQW